MDLTTGLNPAQQQAMSAGTGPTLVLAGPGSGKTRVLTHRIAYLVGNLGVKPYNILAVTFTNKAARQMGERVNELLSGQTRGLQLGTFHSICARILRREAEFMPFDSNFVIFDSDDQQGIVKRAIKDMDLDDKRYRPRAVHASISKAKNELILSDDYPENTYRDEVVKRIYKKYQTALLQSNALDFDDLLLWVAVLLEKQPLVREKYARQFEHILVDEFQDTNMVQYQLLQHLSSFHRNLFVVGDTDQSIYRWRGADYRNVLRFEEQYPDAVKILLEQNYRSTQTILDAAMAVIEHNKFRTHKDLFTDRGEGARLVVNEAFNGAEEGSYIIEEIVKQVKTGQNELGDFAIMYRTNAQSRLLEESFVRNNIPYKLVGAQRFYGRREVKDIIAYLRLVENPADEVSLVRVINTPRRKIGNKTIADLRTVALNAQMSMGMVLLEMAKGPESVKAGEFFAQFGKAGGIALARFGEMLAGWLSEREFMQPLEMVNKVIDDSRYMDYLIDGSEEGHERWENVLEIKRLASDFKDRLLGEFLEEIALVSDQDTVDIDAQVPTLLTLHAAKGLEFPVVFITGLEDGTLPHSRSFDDPEGMAEERRLFYVGITRAMNKLYLVYALNRVTFGYSEMMTPSRFLDDIPPELVKEGNPLHLVQQTRRAQVNRQDIWNQGQDASAGESAQSAAIIEPTFKTGQKVKHSTFGEGMILNSKMEGGDEMVDVFFESVGLKKLMIGFAKLEVIE